MWRRSCTSQCFPFFSSFSSLALWQCALRDGVCFWWLLDAFAPFCFSVWGRILRLTQKSVFIGQNDFFRNDRLDWIFYVRRRNWPCRRRRDHWRPLRICSTFRLDYVFCKDDKEEGEDQRLRNVRHIGRVDRFRSRLYNSTISATLKFITVRGIVGIFSLCATRNPPWKNPPVS